MPTDILLDDGFDLKIEDGDIVFGEATKQNQQLLLLIEKGENRQFPTTGVGLNSYVLDDNPGAVNGEVKRQFERDGMKVSTIKLTAQAGNLTQLEIDATYDF